MIKFLLLVISILSALTPIKTLANENNKELSWYFMYDKNIHQILAPKEAPFLDNSISLYKGDESQKVLYLTFDEGYENGYTDKIIDILNENDVPAAFFVTKSYITSEPSIIKKMHTSGHLVCNHTVKHKSMPTLVGKEDFEKEFRLVEAEFENLTGAKMPIYFRPPMGKFSEASLQETKKLGYISVFWSFAYKDWIVNEQPNEDAAFKKITTNIHNGQVILLHACSKTNATILDKVLKHLKSEGYEFKSLDHLYNLYNS
ncbi:MAG: delta-lactam-biosynthetic de-N-acetylase [Sarcina sp.]